MSELIFHHFAISPFSEKVRLIFGCKGLEWNSVMIPPIMPKPDVVALTGGYRRTPVLQIGADIYCDTALICEVLERRAPTPSLYPQPQAGMARTLAQWADTTLFWSAIGYAFQPLGMKSLFAGMSEEQVKAYSADRAAMRGNGSRMALPEASAGLLTYLDRLEDMLAGGTPYLLGAQVTIADFSVYHPIWFVRRVPELAAVLQRAPKLLAWADRMAALGQHRFEKMSSAEAIEIARNATPAPIDQPFVDLHGIARGERVTITPTDYALDPVEGELVLASQQELAIARHDERAGAVVVHFPRIGFQMKKVAA